MAVLKPPNNRFKDNPVHMTKFALALADDHFRLVAEEASKRGISVPSLFRAVIVPDWIRGNLSEDLQKLAQSH